nr:PREDICTED: DNA polymerase delta subunit 3-like isoform X2 [Megachile rotundata]
MIIESLDEYLETVAGYIFDDDKLVTYKWLSKELEVHVDIAKQILWKFWQKYKKEKSFDCTLLLMGILPDDGMRVEVVKEKDLESAKEKYEKVLSEHIYSLQKVLPNIQLLEMAENGDIKYSAIKCIENNERSNDEMHMLRWGTLSNEVQPASEEKVDCKSEPIKVKEVKEETSPKNKVDDKKKVGQKKGFDNLFGKVTNKQKSISTLSDAKKADSTQATKKGDTSKSSKKPTQGGLSSFLQPTKNEEVKNTVASEIKKDTELVIKEKTEKEVVPNNNKQQKKKTQGKKRNRSKDTTSAAKRRKRITIQDDSSDTDENEGNEDLTSDEEQRRIVESSPEHVSPVKVQNDSPPRIKVENNKRKVLKTVDKTFEEDGFLVTKKVHVYESCSEEEPEIVEPKKSTPPKSKEKKNNKQAAITSFFKKM